MARTDEAELAIRLEAKIRDFERNMDRAAKAAEKNFNRMQADGEKNAKKLEASFGKAADGIAGKFKELGKGLTTGLGLGLAGLGVSELVSQFREVARGVAEIGNEAKRAGLSTKAFQELSFVAEQTRIPVDALTDGMKELSLRADEFITTGTGSGADAFKRLGFNADELSQKLKQPSELFVEIIRRMQKLNRAAQIRVADEIFGGTGGERFVELLDRGADGIDAMIKQANDLGLVLDDQMIAKADEVDRKFNLLAKTIGTNVKGAIVEATQALGTFVDMFNKVPDQSLSTLQATRSLALRQRDAAQKAIDETNLPGFLQGPLRRQLEKSQADLDKIDAEIAKRSTATGQSLGTVAGSADKATAALGALARQAESGSMVSLERYGAGKAKDIAKKGFLDLIGYSEGTDRGRGYNETLGYGKFTGGNVNLTGMTLNEVLALQKRMLADPSNGFNSSAVGRYQITASTLKDFMPRLGLKGTDFFSPEVQDRIANEIIRQTGGDVGKLRGRWTSLKSVGATTIESALGTTQPNLPPVDPGVAQAHQALADKAKASAKAYQDLVTGARQYTAEQATERQALGMTAMQAAALRHEQELLNAAQNAGLTLTPQQRQQITALAGEMATAEVRVQHFAQSQENAQQIADQWRDITGGAIKGFIGDLMQGKSAAEAFGDVLDQIASKLIDMAINDLMGKAFGSTGGGGGGLLSTIGSAIMSIFGFADGGIVKAATGGMIRGPGTGTSDSIPAKLSDGEFVVRAAAVRKHRALLEAINADKIPAFATGGLASTRPVSSPTFSTPGAGNGSPINVTSNVTVNANGGDEKSNQDLAAKTAKAVETQMRVIVQQELRHASRPGGIMRG